MLKTADLIKDKRYPKWFTGHKIFKEVDKVSKVFPGLGLPNSSDEVALDGNATAAKSAKHLLDSIKRELSCQVKRQDKISEESIICQEQLLAISKKIGKNKNDFISTVNGKISLTLPDDIVLNDKAVFKKGERLFSVYNKLNELAKKTAKVGLPKLEDFEDFKTFSSENVPNSKFKVVFSADGADGAWDIATMSMRGIESCQSWNGDYSKCLIGSVIDPFVGIIYLTSGSNTKYGCKMMKRCVVRFAIDSKKNAPTLILDNMYPQFDQQTFTAFKTFLSKRVGDKVEIISTNDAQSIEDMYMPTPPIRKKLSGKNAHYDNEYYDDNYDGIASYQDTPIKNRKSSNKNDKQCYLYNKNSKKKEKLFVDSMSKHFVDALKKLPNKQLPPTIQAVLKKDNAAYYRGAAFNAASRLIAEEIAKTVDRDAFVNSNLYQRRLYAAYFNVKNNCIDKVKTKAAKSVKDRLHVKMFRSDQLVATLAAVAPVVDAAMKEKLKELLKEKPKSNPLPLP